MRRLLLTFGVLLVALSSEGWAQAWPTKPIKVVVPLTAGSATDVMARIVFDQVSQQVGQPIVIENRPGAGNSIGMNAVAKADPDGYTILANSSTHTVSPGGARDHAARHRQRPVRHHPARQHAGGDPVQPEEGLQAAQGLRGLGQGQPGQDQLLVGRRGQLVPSQRRTVPARGRLRGRAPAVQGRARGDDRSDRGARRLLLLTAGQLAAADEGRPVAGARCEQLVARLRPARPADHHAGRLSELGIQLSGPACSCRRRRLGDQGQASPGDREGA